MDREKILEKARKERRDEGVEYARNRGLNWGYLIFHLLYIFLIIANLLIGEKSYSIFSLFWAFFAAESYSRYKFSKTKRNLIMIIVSSLACVIFLALHFYFALR